jgi:peroxiredoxin
MFAVAGVAKLLDRGGSRRAVVAFGVPAQIATPVGWALLCAELGIAASLVVGPTARAGAAAATVLLLAFSAAIVANLTRGRTPDCHCFGRLSSGPVGWPNMARNGAFATLAMFIAIGGRLGWLFAGLAITLFGVWVGPTWKRRWAHRIGATAPDFSLADPHGQSYTLDSLLGPRRPLVLVFAQAGCAACDALLPDVARWQHDLAERVTVAVVNGGPAEHSHRTSHQHGLQRVLIDERRRVLAAYGVTGTPSAVLIDARRTLAAPPARGAGAIHALIESTAAVTDQGSDLSRRRVLRRAAVGFASVAVLPAVSTIAAACSSIAKKTPATTAPNADVLEVDGAWLCNQTFALCTTAPCEPSKTDPGISVCHCVVENGYSIGFKSCTDRAQSGTKLVSDFSTVNVNPSFAVLACPSGVPWANCLDMPCEIDPTNPALANCQCHTVNTGESLTFGGGCEPSTCTSTVWSAATPDLPGSTQYIKGMKQLNQPITFPKNCPTTGTTTTVSPTATPTK